MHSRRGQFILSIFATAIWILFIVIGQTQRPIWTAGVGFFVTIGIASMLMTLGWVLPGWAGKILRHPIFNVVAVLAVVSMFLMMIYYAFIY